MGSVAVYISALNYWLINWREKLSHLFLTLSLSLCLSIFRYLLYVASVIQPLAVSRIPNAIGFYYSMSPFQLDCISSYLFDPQLWRRCISFSFSFLDGFHLWAFILLTFPYYTRCLSSILLIVFQHFFTSFINWALYSTFDNLHPLLRNYVSTALIRPLSRLDTFSVVYILSPQQGI